MKLQDGRLVKWLDADGGWQVGCELTTDEGDVVTTDSGVTCCALESEESLVKVWPTGDLVFVRYGDLQDRETRND